MMATTSIWAVKGWLGKVVIYAENPDKTKNPAYYEKQGMTAAQAQGLSDVIDYAAQSQKSELLQIHGRADGGVNVQPDERTEIMRRFVSGVNCQPDTARDEMLAVKARFSKTEGVVAYHGYQSFAPGEATPEMAHKIGVKLAENLWGDKYQVIVATHLDKSHHLHNHFVVNNVSMVDGKKYYRSERDYWLMKKESDALCREYGLSVIEKPKREKSKHYGELRAENENRPTWRSLVKADVDTAIKQSMTERQFWDNLRKMGYEIKTGKDISVRPPGKERFVRLRRNFGDDYDIESIRRRILAQRRPERQVIPADKPPKKVYVKGSIHKAKRMTGLRALYFYYLYRMGVLPKKRKREPNPKQVYFLFREDIRHMQNIAQETRLLVKHGIDTAEQLTAYKDSVTAQMNTLSRNRKRLRNKTRSITDAGELAAIKTEITALSGQISELRREVKLCEDIETRSVEMKDKLHRAHEAETIEKFKGKERMSHEPFRGRR